MTLNYLIIGKRITAIRKEKNFTQARLAECIDKSTGYISYIETGKKIMSLETLVQIANAFGVSVDTLLVDVVSTNQQESEKEFQSLFGDCSLTERRVIIENAKALKGILKDHNF